MKLTKNIFGLLAIFIISQLFYSCDSLEYAVVKRKYRDGFFVSKVQSPKLKAQNIKQKAEIAKPSNEGYFLTTENNIQQNNEEEIIYASVETKTTTLPLNTNVSEPSITKIIYKKNIIPFAKNNSQKSLNANSPPDEVVTKANKKVRNGFYVSMLGALGFPLWLNTNNIFLALSIIGAAASIFSVILIIFGLIQVDKNPDNYRILFTVLYATAGLILAFIMLALQATGFVNYFIGM